MNRQRIRLLQEQYPPGTRIQLDSMSDDPRPIPAGTKGTVRLVDDMGGEISELTRFEVHSKEAFELAAKLWGLDLAEEGFAFNEKTQTYEYHDPEEAPDISPKM